MATIIKATVAASTVGASLAETFSNPMKMPHTINMATTASFVGTEVPPQIPPMKANINAGEIMFCAVCNSEWDSSRAWVAGVDIVIEDREGFDFVDVSVTICRECIERALTSADEDDESQEKD